MKFQMLGNSIQPGPVRLSDVYASEIGDSFTGIAASQKALYDAYNSINDKVDSLISIPTVSNLGIQDADSPPSNICRYSSSTLNTPYKQGLTSSTNGTIITSCIDKSYKYQQQIALSDGSYDIFIRRQSNSTTYPTWSKIQTTLGLVSGVKGNSESTYRTGNVNLTAANIGAAASSHTHDDRYYTESEITTNYGTVTSGAATCNTSLGTFASSTVMKLGKMIYVNLRTYNTTTAKNISSGTTVFTLPSGFRPSANRCVGGMVAHSSYSASIPGVFTVNSSGAVTPPSSLNYYHIWVVGVFPM